MEVLVSLSDFLTISGQLAPPSVLTSSEKLFVEYCIMARRMWILDMLPLTPSGSRYERNFRWLISLEFHS